MCIIYFYRRETHKAVDDQKKAFTCSYCGRNFRKAVQVQQHENTHTGNRPYKCKYCDKTFSWMSERNKHEASVHSSNRPFTCTECPRGFKLKSQLHSHMVTHTKDSKHTCHYCGKFYTLASTLRRHRCKLAPPGVYEKNDDVGMLTDDGENLIVEAPSVKEEGNVTVFMCGICNQVFTDKETVHKHMYDHVDSDITVLVQEENGHLEAIEIEAAANTLTKLANAADGSNSDPKPDHDTLGMEIRNQGTVEENSNQQLENMSEIDINNIRIVSGSEYEETVQHLTNSKLVQEWSTREQGAEQNGETVVQVISQIPEENQEIIMEQSIVAEHGEAVQQGEGQEVVIAHVVG